MSLSKKIDQDYLEAYKTKQMDRVGVLRLLKAAAKNRLVELKRPGGVLSDDEMLAVILSQAKQREDSIEQYNGAGRPDLAEKEAAELAVLGEYLPPKLSEAELIAAIEEAVVSAGAAPAMGRIIGEIMAKYKGRVDGKDVSRLVKVSLEKASKAN